MLSTVQMPPGVPVATVAIGKAGAKNAAILAVQILALSDKGLAGKLAEFKKLQAKKVAKSIPENIRIFKKRGKFNHRFHGLHSRQGQSQEKQVTDRNECHNWAVSQTGYDPSKPPSVSLTEAQIAQKSSDYYRAFGACLDARGYSMR